MTRRSAKNSIQKWVVFGFVASFLFVLGGYLIQRETKPFCANSISCQESFNLKVENGVAGVFGGQNVAAPAVDLSKKESGTKVLGEATATGEKHIYVDLTTQTLTAYEGDKIFLQTAVSTGKWFPTPPGEYTIWEKIRATRMSGGQGADYYNLPNVPFVMFFSGSGVPAGAGFSLHGAYWHNNFGHPMSHGCVNMRIIDAEKIYNWANPVTTGSYTPATKDDPGTKITIYGKTPL